MSSADHGEPGARDDDLLRLADGRRVGVSTFGDPQGRPVIALHGMPSSRLMYSAVGDAAGQHGIRLIAPDRPGYGRSDPCPGGTLLSYADDVAGIADILGVGRFAILGASGGGSYAVACAARLGARSTRLGLISPIGPLRTPGSLSGMASVNRWIFRLARVSPMLVGAILPRLVRRSLPKMDAHVSAGTSPSPTIPPAIFRLVVEDQREAIRQGGAGVTYDAANLWRPWRFALNEIKTPAHLWHGDRDDLAPLTLARRVAESLTACQTTIYPGEGHAEPLTRHADEIMLAMAGPR